MPRISRKCYNSKFFHIMVQGINREHIFEKYEEKEKFFELMNKYSDKNGVKIVSYCIMSNHVHMVVFVEEMECLSKMMLAINTQYAIFYNKNKNRCGYVFRDRYRCQNIFTQSHLECCIRYVHYNPVKAGICRVPQNYMYSSYKNYIDKSIGEDIIELIFGNYEDYYNKLNISNDEYDFIDVDNEFGIEKNSYRSVNDVLREYCEHAKIRPEEFMNDNIIQLFRLMKKECKVSNDEIANCIGISRYRLYRILNKVEQGAQRGRPENVRSQI